jgi:hypothetical protein
LLATLLQIYYPVTVTFTVGGFTIAFELDDDDDDDDAYKY